MPSWPDTPSADLAEYKSRVDDIPEAVEGSRGSDATYHAACEIRRWELCEDDSWELMEHYNSTRCYPLWDHDELRRKFNDGCKAELAKRAENSADNEFEPVEADGKAPSFRKYTLAELTSQHPKLNKPVVDGLFREGETCNIVAAPKIGKSWLGYGLGLSIASGRPWLDRFEVSKGKVLIVDNELHPSTLASRLTRVANAMGISMDDLADTIEVWPLRGALKSLTRLSADFDLLKPGEVKAVILDAKYRFAVEGQSENDNATETALYNLVDRYAMKTKAAFVLVHHSSKGDQSGKAITDVGAGAGAQARAVDCHAVLRQHEADDCVVLEAAVRSFAPVEPITLRFEYPTWAPDAALDPSHLATKDNNRERRTRNDKRDKETLLMELRGVGEATVSKLSKIMSIGSPRLSRLMMELVSEGKATVAESLVSGNMCKVYTPTVEGSDVGV